MMCGPPHSGSLRVLTCGIRFTSLVAPRVLIAHHNFCWLVHAGPQIRRFSGGLVQSTVSFSSRGCGVAAASRIFFSKHTFNDTLSKFSNFCNIYFFFYKEENREVQGCRGHILLVVVVVVSKAAREMLSLC